MNDPATPVVYRVSPLFMLGTLAAVVGLAWSLAGFSGLVVAVLGLVVGLGLEPSGLQRTVRRLELELEEARTAQTIRLDVDSDEIAERALDHLCEKYPEIAELVDRHRPELRLIRPGEPEEEER